VSHQYGKVRVLIGGSLTPSGRKWIIDKNVSVCRRVDAAKNFWRVITDPLRANMLTVNDTRLAAGKDRTALGISKGPSLRFIIESFS
jgi:hypothetical protein